MSDSTTPSLSAADAAAIRERIARRCGVPVEQLTPQTNLIRDLRLDGAALGFLLALLESSMQVKILPTLKNLQREFQVADGDLTPAARVGLKKLLPARLDWDHVHAAEFDDLWTVALLEAAVAKSIGERPGSYSGESIWDWQQQDWLKKVAKDLGARKVRLLLAACCRHSFAPRQDLETEVVTALDMLERFADTGKTKKDLRTAQQALEQWRLDRVPELKALHAALAATKPEAALSIACSVIHHAHKISEGEALERFRAFQHDLSSPLKDADFDPAWRTPALVGLAQALYESRDFRRLPELATALAEAGCSHARIMGHAREPATAHIRGCWLIDAVLDGSWAAPPKTKRLSP